MNATPEPYFGHTFIRTRILRAVASASGDCFAVVGARLTGKTALLRYLAITPMPNRQNDGGADMQRPLRIYIDCTQYESQSALWRALVLALHPQVEPALDVYERENQANSPYELFLQVHAAVVEADQRLIILLDNVDHLLIHDAQPALLCAQLYPLAADAVLILSLQQPLYDLSAKVADSVLCGAITHLFIGLLEQEAAAQWLAHHIGGLGVDNGADVDVRHALLALTGCHPFLLHKLGDCLAEALSMLPAGWVTGLQLLPFLRLRLAEHGRPLLLAQRNLLLTPPINVAGGALAWLVDRLRRASLRLDAIAADRQPALNWLINQAVIACDADVDGVAYQLYSPLLADFLEHVSGTDNVDDPKAAPLAATARQDVETWPLYDKLTKIEATLLRYLQQHSSSVVPIDQLLAAVWKRPDASSRRVQEAIRRLRLQLEQQQPPIGEIKNERGRGYRFIPA